MKTIGIIPARLQSKRLVNKALLKFNNKPLLQHTYEAVKNSSLFNQIYIATDSKLIQDTAQNFNAEVIMTSKENKNGTERCIDLVQKLSKNIQNDDLVINIQCDEPFLKLKHFKTIIQQMNGNVQIATLMSPIKKEELNDPNAVKVSVDKNFIASKFSRLLQNFKPKEKLYKHIGIYAYKKKTLLKLSKLNEVEMEKKESLEQLRWLKNNYKVHCSPISENIVSINTQEDVKKVLKK